MLRLVATDPQGSLGPLDFDEVITRVRPRLHRYALRRLGDPHEAEELVQEALLRAYSHRDELHTEDDLSAWSTVVTGRLVIDRLRVRGRSTSVAEVPEDARLGRDTADVVVARDEARTALDALDAMPTRQAALLWAREVEGHSYEELCKRFAMSEAAVRSVLTRARKALRKEYELRGGTLPVGGLALLAPWIAGLSWAGKLRRVAARVTAPAALATLGVTALGGLMLSPFGGSFAQAPGGYTPLPAVVAQAMTMPGAHSVHVAPGVRRPAAATRAAAEAPASGPTQLTNHPLKALNHLPCTTTAPLAPTPTGQDLPTSEVAVGGSACHTRTDRTSVSVPGGSATGYNELAFESSDVHCDTLAPATHLPASPMKCTPRESQP